MDRKGFPPSYPERWIAPAAIRVRLSPIRRARVEIGRELGHIFRMRYRSCRGTFHHTSPPMPPPLEYGDAEAACLPERKVTMNRAPMILALLVAALAQTAAAQTSSPATDASRSPAAPAPDPGGPRGAIFGFVYSGRPVDGTGMRWEDYPVVRHVFSGSPAEAAGLRVGDAILRVNGREGTEMTAYHDRRVGKAYTLVVQRGMREVEVSFTLVEPTWPASEWTPPAETYSAP
ncbi:PDZ domain-containing protein [Longimicrobium sp.]|uniref:PDZ domain-containing protein n=1 Tax=Longimicrobium sp. TaxID=2029185 RepID=UPI002E3483C0|nr:PDZ domain-containing protein [Longimicrobium sp.]HEX6036507.1 PDZ domain-containing protein [Longimicrobium sp.]